MIQRNPKPSGKSAGEVEVGSAKSSASSPETVGEARVPDKARRGTSKPVDALSSMIESLEGELDRMLAINRALEKDLESERKARLESERARGELEDLLRRAESDAAEKDDLHSEIDYLRGERARLTGVVDDLQQKLREAETERQRQEQAAEQLRAGRVDVLEELETVEAQFDRAMQIVADLKTRLAVMTEEYDALRGSLKTSERKLKESERERESLLAEVEDSRSALEEIRRSLVDACVSAQHRHLDDDER